jgi:hypothetical protein
VSALQLAIQGVAVVQKCAGICFVIFVLLFSGSVFAHHGTAAYDTSTMVTIKGTVTEFQFINPHCQIYWDAKGDTGEVEKWQGELTAPNKLARAGWSKDTLKSGDSITVTGYRTKSGSHAIWIRTLIGPDGKALPLTENQD